MGTPDDDPILPFASKAKFAAWLKKEHARSDGLWLKIAKKNSGIPTVSYLEAVDVALCYGWIDGLKRGFDDSYFLQRFTPRRKASTWSQINVEKAEALIADGLMQPAGLAEVERAKADGRWESAYAGQRTATVPDDLQAALDANPKAKEFFATINGANRFAIIYRVGDAKRPETRAKRIKEYVAMLERGETIHLI